MNYQSLIVGMLRSCDWIDCMSFIEQILVELVHALDFHHSDRYPMFLAFCLKKAPVLSVDASVGSLVVALPVHCSSAQDRALGQRCSRWYLVSRAAQQ
ncbi:hypothetical protein M433DRAFT_276127 [Acidomyces richmondensis BFW]|nr:hypothetical protein M433DRAFT_276127 [Acidomyces richmondensis BFW]